MTVQKIFIDSSAIYALVDKDDASGPPIESFLKEKKPFLVTTNFIFAEALSLITKRLSKRVGIQTGEFLQNSRVITIIFLEGEIQKEAWNYYKKYKDKDFDFIDATSFIFCHTRGIREVITLDHHFSQMGFKTVP